LLKYSKCLLFADDLKIFKSITAIQDIQNLQLDLRALVDWSVLNSLPLNIKKRKVVTFTRTRNPIPALYNIQGEQLEQVHTIRDLGVLMDGKLGHSQHLQKMVAKARQNGTD